ncbi:MAG TPA: hypothetical protein PKK10_13395 [Woeseiaceae bacterium]|nr:hypothetical protein [Woeseiaceae bacterium]
MESAENRLIPEDFRLRLQQYTERVRRDRRLSGNDVWTTTRQSRHCGSRLTLDGVIADGRIQALGYAVRACSLGQATTAIVAERALGMKAEELQAIQAQLKAVLQGQPSQQKALIWPELAIFRYAAGMPSRHGSALLPFQALQDLFELMKTFGDPALQERNNFVPAGELGWLRAEFGDI